MSGDRTPFLHVIILILLCLVFLLGGALFVALTGNTISELLHGTTRLVARTLQ